MTAQLFEQDEEFTVRLPWPIICALACRALVEGTDLDGITAAALAARLRASASVGVPPVGRGKA